MNELENLISNLETIAESTVDDFMDDELLCASAARVAGEAAAALKKFRDTKNMELTK